MLLTIPLLRSCVGCDSFPVKGSTTQRRITQARASARAAETPEPPVTSTMDLESTEKATVPSDAISPSYQGPPSSVVLSTPVIDTAATLASLCTLKVYLRSYALDQMVQVASASYGLRTIKHVEQTLQDLGQANFAGDSETAFLAEPLIFGGERVVKKDHRRKAP